MPSRQPEQGLINQLEHGDKRGLRGSGTERSEKANSSVGNAMQCNGTLAPTAIFSLKIT
jgi:hypothetical protein